MFMDYFLIDELAKYWALTPRQSPSAGGCFARYQPHTQTQHISKQKREIISPLSTSSALTIWWLGTYRYFLLFFRINSEVWLFELRNWKLKSSLFLFLI